MSKRKHAASVSHTDATIVEHARQGPKTSTGTIQKFAFHEQLRSASAID